MKKLFVLMAAAFAMVACQTDINEVGVAADGVATVEFEVGAPQMRSYSDGLTVDDLQYAVYEVKGEGENKTLTHLDKLNGTQPLSGLHTNVQIELANNKKYAVIFWADGENAPYEFKPAEKTVTVDYDADKTFCNDENRDAFYAYKEFEVKGAAKIDVVLKRPFAQVNVGTSDIEAAKKSGFTPSTSALVVKNACNVLNLATGEATGGVDVTFKANAIPTGEDFPYNKAEYKYLAMSYVLVGKDQASYDVTYTITDGTTSIENTIGAVPMRANYRTNIYGKLLTSTTDIDVEINPDYYEPSNELSALQKAALNGGTVTLTENVVLTTPLNVLAEMTIDLNGKTITGPSVAKDADGNRIHSIINNGKLSIINGTISSVAVNGGSAIYTYGALTLENVTINGAPTDKATGYAAYAVNAEGTAAKLIVNNSTINGRGAVGVTNGAKAELNGGVYHTPAVAWGHAVYAVDEGTQVVINGGTFSEGYDYAADLWGMYQIYSGDKAQVIVNGGTFENWDCANGYDLCTATEGTITIYGGTFADNPASQNGKNFVAEGYAVVENNGAYTVIPTTLKDGGVLDLGGAEYNGTITVEGNVTIKGDTKVKTIKSTTGCTITIEDGKTLTLNNFSFGAKDNAEAVYEIKGGTVTADYGFFQHGKYELYSNFETGYMYYSYGSDITVHGTFHSQGKGDGLDYVRGKLTIANGGKSIHDKSLWVGQPASWGAMNASLVIEKGGYVQANSLSVYEGSTLTYSNDADLKYNSVTGTEYIIKK